MMRRNEQRRKGCVYIYICIRNREGDDVACTDSMVGENRPVRNIITLQFTENYSFGI